MKLILSICLLLVCSFYMYGQLPVFYEQVAFDYFKREIAPGEYTEKTTFKVDTLISE
jgi:hypothetical protein